MVDRGWKIEKYPFSIFYLRLLRRSFIFLDNYLHPIVRATFRADVVRQMQGMALRTGDHVRHVQAQVMRPAAVAPDTRNLSFR
jgi:hypothetical protein